MTHSENWLIAANRSGKTDAGAYAGSKLARFGNPDAKFVGSQGSSVSIKDKSTSGWVVGLDFPMLRDAVQPKYFDNGVVPPGATHRPFIPKREVLEWRQTDQLLKLKNGSIIGFKSADSGPSKFQSTEKDWVHFDEEPPKPIYDEVVIRVGARPLRLFGTCTLLPPEGQVGGVSWMFPEIIRKVQSGERKGVGLFGASIYDNPHIPRGEIARLEAIYPEGSVQRRIRLDGEWLPGLGGARAYVSFNSALHIKPQGEIVLRRPLAWFWDFNVEPMVSGLGQRVGNTFKILKEFILDEGDIGEMVQTFIDFHPRHGSEIYLYGDATGKNRSHQTNKSSYQIIMNHMLTYGVPVRLKVPESNPPVPDRVNAVNRSLKNELGEINIEIDPGCKELNPDMEQVLRDNRGGIKKTNNSKDPYYRRTHISDACGYWVSYEAPVRAMNYNQDFGGPSIPPIPSPKYGFRR